MLGISPLAVLLENRLFGVVACFDGRDLI